MTTLSALVIVVLSPFPQLWRHVHRCVVPRGHVVVQASNVEEARKRVDTPDVVAVDGFLLAQIGWRGRELAETLSPDRRIPLLGLVRRDAHRPPATLDLTRAGIVALYEPFLAPELNIVVNWLGHTARMSPG